METGIVKWFSNAKGYGFISPDDGGGDIFAHFSAIEMDGYRTLRRGQKVRFNVSQGPKGLLASGIQPDGSQDSSSLSDNQHIALPNEGMENRYSHTASG